MIIGCDFHPSWQQVNWLDPETGDCGERKLVHGSGEAQRFYRQLAAPVLIGMEATGNSQWFIEMVEDLGHEIWIGDAAQIRASYVRKQKTDKRDAGHILQAGDGGPVSALVDAGPGAARSAAVGVSPAQAGGDSQPGEKRTATPFPESGSAEASTSCGARRDRKCCASFRLKPWAACRREDLLGLLAMLNQQVGVLDAAVQQAAEENPQARLLMTQPGVGPNTALAYVLTIGDVSRFARGKQVASYLGLIPREHSSGGRQKLGSITKQGNRLLRRVAGGGGAEWRCASTRR